LPFRAPQFETDHFDLDEHVAHARAGAMIRGVFFRDLIARADAVRAREELFALARISARPYLPLGEYPLADWVRLVLAGARVLHRGVRWAEGLRRMGHAALPAFMTTKTGTMIFELLAPDLEAVLLQAPKIYAIITSAGPVSVERLAPRHVQLFYEGFPGMIEHHQVGVVEGVLRYMKQPARIQVDLWGFGSGVLDVRW
jgi:uncharacterized protein (TIGR02265 family)